MLLGKISLNSIILRGILNTTNGLLCLNTLPKNMLRSKISRAKLDQLIAPHKTDKRVLDVGSGRSPYKHLFPNSTSIDSHPESGADIIGDALQLPIKDAEFEHVNCFELLEHVHDPQKCVDEIYRVLKPGGTLLLSTRFNFSVHHAPHDYYRFTRYGLEYLLRRFEIASIEAETVNFETIGVLLQRIVFQSELRLSFIFAPCFLVAARCVSVFNRLILRQYGRRNRSIEDKEVLASGYFVVCIKSKSVF